MKHIIRAVALLAGVLFVAFILPRLIPDKAVEGLENYGFYSGSSSSQWEEFPLQYADTIRCNTCHADNHTTWVEAAHKSVSCENCHGPGEKHIEEGISLEIDTSRQLCETCHDQVVGRPSDFPQIDSNIHGNQNDCLTCHDPHSPYIPVIAHKVEGYDDCLLCHKTGGLKPVPENHEGRDGNSCLSCHGVQ